MLRPVGRFWGATVAAVAILAATLSACATSPVPTARPAPSAPPVVGGDRDAHGCIGSAGYTWCARENACVRSWELAAQRGFAKGDADAFVRYCATPADR